MKVFMVIHKLFEDNKGNQNILCNNDHSSCFMKQKNGLFLMVFYRIYYMKYYESVTIS